MGMLQLFFGKSEFVFSVNHFDLTFNPTKAADRFAVFIQEKVSTVAMRTNSVDSFIFCFAVIFRSFGDISSDLSSPFQSGIIHNDIQAPRENLIINDLPHRSQSLHPEITLDQSVPIAAAHSHVRDHFIFHKTRIDRNAAVFGGNLISDDHISAIHPRSETIGNRMEQSG